VRSTKRSKSFLAAEAIAAYVELNEWQIGEIAAGLAELDSGAALSGLRIAVGTRITERPPHRTVRSGFPHTAPTLGV